ncbi:MAG: hypothetical protein L0Z68_09945 [Gammaproteobacteria bacterium]|nr:hypothetical protein [Gammaproteobacteria bacterium]
MNAGGQGTFRPKEYVERRDRASGWDINIVSYKLGKVYHCEIDNVSPGAKIAKGEGDTREEAEAEALRQANERLAKTRRFPT